MEANKFWTVYVKGRTAPKLFYSTLEGAMAEAERLAARGDGPVHVLETVKVCKPIPVRVVWEDLEDRACCAVSSERPPTTAAFSSGSLCACGRPWGHPPDAACPPPTADRPDTSTNRIAPWYKEK